MIFAEIITIGDEILIGQIVDTNSAFIARELNKLGISVYQITSVQDEREHILAALGEASSRADIILTTGGLGPTKDDITKHTLCAYFDDFLVERPDVLEHIELLFRNYLTTPISDLNRQQALVPSRADVLPNAFGTAPGMWFEDGQKVFISLPGVPFEMKHLLTEVVIPRLATTFERPFIVHRTIITYGLGESAIAERIGQWEDALPAFIRLAYLPNLGKVRLRLTAKGPVLEVLEQAVNVEVEKLYGIIGDIIYGLEAEEAIEAIVSRLLIDKKVTLATAESFTGGKIAEIITSIPGASACFVGSIVSYATRVKADLLGVPWTLIRKHSVVSKEVAEAMAVRVREIMSADIGIATTGNAGPDKGDSDADIGTVFIAIATEKGVSAERFSMGNHRTRIVAKSVNKAFELLHKEILNF